MDHIDKAKSGQWLFQAIIVVLSGLVVVAIYFLLALNTLGLK
jgi:hypothetical protein